MNKALVNLSVFIVFAGIVLKGAFKTYLQKRRERKTFNRRM